MKKQETHCELNLSADHKWLRVTVNGKQVVSFHINYINTILNSTEVILERKLEKKAARLLQEYLFDERIKIMHVGCKCGKVLPEVGGLRKETA